MSDPHREPLSRNLGGGPSREGPPRRVLRRDPSGGDPPGGGPIGGEDLNNDERQRNRIHTGKISSHISIFDGDRIKAKKFQMEFSVMCGLRVSL